MWAHLQYRGDLELGENQSVERYSRTTHREESQNGNTTDSSASVWSHTGQDLAHVEDSSQATSFRKGFDHNVVHCLRESIYQRADQLLFVTTYVVNNDPLWRVFAIIIVQSAHACYRSIDHNHLTKKCIHEHSSNPSSSSSSWSSICVA